MIAPNRNLHKEGDLSFYKNAKGGKSGKRHVFCFTDLIMLTSRKDDKKFVHKLSISLDGCKITVLANSQRLFLNKNLQKIWSNYFFFKDLKNAFELHQAKNRGILACDTAAEASDWVNAIRGLIKEYQKRKIREVKEAQEKGKVSSSSLTY